MANRLVEIVSNPSLPVRKKSDLVAAELGSLPDQGASLALEALSQTGDPRIASFAANHLSRLPGLHKEKRAAAERLLNNAETVIAAASLVRFLPGDLTDRMVRGYLSQPSDSSPFYSLVFEIAMYFPDRLRAFAEQIQDPPLRAGMLSGAPPDWVDALARRYRETAGPEQLEQLGRTHTEEAAKKLLELRPAAPAQDEEAWTAALENAGRLPEGGSSIHGKPFEGFVLPRGASPHRMGGRIEGKIPTCPACDRPANRLLALDTSALPYDLRKDRIPQFFWFECGCLVVSYIVVQILEDGLKVLLGPEADQGSGTGLIPEERSLLLEDHPNPTGISMDMVSGMGRHQVGGFPPWLRIEALPLCPLCRAPMRFLASIDSGMTAVGRLDFAGTLFGFWCDSCAVSTSYNQRS